MVAVLACGGEGDTATGSPSTTADATETTAALAPTLTIEGRSFGQAPEVAAGESFTIINLDSTRHTFSSSDGSWEQVDLPADSQVPFTVPDSLAPGRYVFFCAIHSDMGGSLTIAG
jgi:plastocyanin